MKLISNVILVMLCSLFTILSSLYADTIQDENELSYTRYAEKMRIAKTVFNWTIQHKRAPGAKDFKSDLSLGATSSDISKKFNFGIKGELKEMLLDLDTKGKITKLILQSTLSKEYWYQSTPERREKLQNHFIKFVLLPWMDKNKRFFRLEDTSSKSESYIGFSVLSIYTFYPDEKRFGFFENSEDLLQKTLCLVLNIDKKDIETLSSKDIFLLLEHSILTGEDRYIDWILKSDVLFVDICKNEFLLEIFKKYFLIKYMPSFINQDNSDISTFLRNSKLSLSTIKSLFNGGIIQVLEELFNIGNYEKKYQQYGLKFLKNKLEQGSLSGASGFLPKNLILQIINADTEKKYIKYILQYAVLPNDMYNNKFILNTFQEVAITDFFFPYMDKYHRLPVSMILQKDTKNRIRNHNIQITTERVEKIFPIKNSSSKTDRRYIIVSKIIELDKEQKYTKYILKSPILDIFFNNPYLIEKFRESYVRDYLIPWIKVHKRFPILEDFKQYKTVQEGNENSIDADSPYLFSNVKIIRQGRDDLALFDGIRHLRAYYEVIKKYLGFDDSFINKSSSTNNDNLENETTDTSDNESKLDTSFLYQKENATIDNTQNCIDLFSVIYVYPY